MQAHLRVDMQPLGGGHAARQEGGTTGTLRFRMPRPIGPSSWCRAESRRTRPVARRGRPRPPAWATCRLSRPDAAGSAGAVADRACAPAQRSPDPDSSPCRGAPRSRSIRPRWGSSDGRCRGRAEARPVDPQRLERPAATRLTGCRAREVEYAVRALTSVADRATAAHSSVTSSTSTRIMKRIESSQATRLGAAPGSTCGEEDLTVVGAGHRVLDMATRRQHQRRDRLIGGEVQQVLCRQRVQPGRAGRVRRSARHRDGRDRQSRHRPAASSAPRSGSP